MADDQARDYAPEETFAIREMLDRLPQLEADARSIGAERLATLLADADDAAKAHGKAAGLIKPR